MVDTPLWAYEIKSTYVHPYPTQNESKQNPLIKRGPKSISRNNYSSFINFTAIFKQTMS